MVGFTPDTYCPTHYIMSLEKALHRVIIGLNWINCFFSYSSESLNEDTVLFSSQHHFWTRIPSLPFIFIRMLYTLSLQPSLYNHCYHSTPDKSLVSLWITSVEYSYVYFPTNFNWPHSYDFQIDVGSQCNSSSSRHLTLLNNPDLYLSLF